ncbi:redox-active disulfide protein 2 [Thermotomaculum hydrothermale]|uniref:Redox-active disulfide protein 2 n=1 Tax=Thermotomaculum hydrothermale TaxID=981385 RepID=A0A7R6SYX5_9BACT|nr:thioredoxin family protein [Thermotomaculum hydrothermale]BBB33046.1 redox-active disulfide protein 2 [Thermotomaculum hydrothermale]
MIELKVLGTGCPKCRLLEERAIKAVEELGIPYELKKVTDIREIMSHGVMMTPALVVNGEVKFVGHVPMVKKIQEVLKETGV